MTGASLYDRLGGAEGIPKLVDDIVGLHLENEAIKARFIPLTKDPEKLAEARGHLINFLSMGSGGSEEYKGRSMTDAHFGMNISDGEYMAAIDDIMAAMKKHNIDEQSQKDVLAITYSLKNEIVYK